MKKALLTALLAALLSTAAGADEAAIILHTEQSPPFQYLKDGQIHGDTVDIVRELFKRAAIPYSMHLEPWATAYNTTKKTPGHGLFALVRTPERESAFQWVGPISSTKWVFYAKKSRNLKLAQVKDAFAYKIGCAQGDAKAIYLTDLGAPNLSPVQDDALNAKRLERGEIDLWVTGSKSGRWNAEKAGVKDLEEVLTFREDFGYLGLNNETNIGKVFLLQKTLEQMRAEGKLDKVIKLN